MLIPHKIVQVFFFSNCKFFEWLIERAEKATVVLEVIDLCSHIDGHKSPRQDLVQLCQQSLTNLRHMEKYFFDRRRRARAKGSKENNKVTLDFTRIRNDLVQRRLTRRKISDHVVSFDSVERRNDNFCAFYFFFFFSALLCGHNFKKSHEGWRKF